MHSSGTLTIAFSFVLYFTLNIAWSNLGVSAEVHIDHRIDCTPHLPECLDKCVDLCTVMNKAGICEMDKHIDDTNKTPKRVPLCYMKPEAGYTGVKETTDGLKLTKQKAKIPLWYGADELELDVKYKKIGEVLKVSIGNSDRFVPPVELNESNISTDSKENLVFKYKKDPVFSFTVERENSNAKPLWNTAIGGFIFSDQFIQIATELPSKFMYGWGEHVHWEINHDFNKYWTWGMFARDKPLMDYGEREYSQNYYGVHPFYMMIEDDGKAHGVFIFNSNAQEVTTGPKPHLIYRTIGGKLDIFFFPGPTPEQVLQQYHQLIGKPSMPAYWAFGFQLCAYGYHSADEVAKTIEQQVKVGIPVDVAYADIDYMDRFKDFTLDEKNWKNLPAVANKLHAQNRKLILIYDPAIPVEDKYKPFEDAVEKDVRFIEWPNSKGVMLIKQNHDIFHSYAGLRTLKEKHNRYPMVGVVWPDGHVVFPDFFYPSTVDWWIRWIKYFYGLVPHDGLWLDMNEPAVFGTNQDRPDYWPKSGEQSRDNQMDEKRILPLRCPMDHSFDEENCKYDNPPYHTISGRQWPADKQGWHPMIVGGTLCLQGEHANKANNGKKMKMYDAHNIYGWSETKATYKAQKEVMKKRGAVIARSTFPSSGKYGGHWLGDNLSTWEHMRFSVIGAMEFNMFGIPYVGADVCGFLGDSNEDLCLRWQQLGAFHSFYRNHNAKRTNNDKVPYQDPGRVLPNTWPRAQVATREANNWRYRYLPYLYTLHVIVSKKGGSVVRPLFFDYVSDKKTHTMSEQFMWGSAILVCPVVNEDQHKSKKLDGYFPPSASWYSISKAYKEGLLLEPKNAREKAGTFLLDAPENTPSPVFVKGGTIIPRQDPALTTTDARKNGFDLLIALENTVDLNQTVEAKGELYWDDGDSWIENIDSYDHYHCTFVAKVTKSNTELNITCKREGTKGKDFHVPPLKAIEILGYKHQPKLDEVKVNNVPLNLNSSSTYDPTKKIVRVKSGFENHVKFANTGTWKITWNHGGKAKL